MNQPGPAARSAEDILAIQAVVVLYGFLIDDREWDRFDQVFTEDAVVDFRDHSAQPPRGLAPIVGRAEIVRQFRDVLTHPYQHMLVNQRPSATTSTRRPPGAWSKPRSGNRGARSSPRMRFA